MGLEQVELLLDVEHTFGIKIGDEDDYGQHARTVGEFYDIVSRVARQSSPLSNDPNLETLVWDCIVTCVLRESPGTQAAQVRRETRFVEDLGFG